MAEKPAAFTRAMRKTHTIYMPDMLHYHNELLKAAFRFAGYRLDVVPEYRELTQSVYKTVNPDYCTCAVGIVGNLLTMAEDARFAGKPIAFLEPQMGGACRAGNYYELIISSLRRCGRGEIPVLSLNLKGQEKQPGFRLNARMLFAGLAAICLGDMLMALLLQLRPYEKHEGETQALYERWITRLSEALRQGRCLLFRKALYRQIAADFAALEMDEARRGRLKKVGVVGEIYIKFSPVGNRHLEELLQEKHCEYRLGGFLNYCMFVLYTDMVSARLNGKGRGLLAGYQTAISLLERIQRSMHRVMEEYGFCHDALFSELKDKAKEIISEDYVIGDGWLIAGETADHVQKGYDRVLAVHPFGCLVSHVGTRGTLGRIRELYPAARVQSIEYDYDQSEAMRESRILLALH